MIVGVIGATEQPRQRQALDAGTVNACEPEWAEDYPANTRRLAQRAEGVHYTIVNGTIVQQDGALSGDLPGQVLRGAAYSALQTVAA